MSSLRKLLIAIERMATKMQRTFHKAFVFLIILKYLMGNFLLEMGQIVDLSFCHRLWRKVNLWNEQFRIENVFDFD